MQFSQKKGTLFRNILIWKKDKKMDEKDINCLGLGHNFLRYKTQHLFAVYNFSSSDRCLGIDLLQKLFCFCFTIQNCLNLQGWATLLALRATLETSKVSRAGIGPCKLILRLFLW